MTEIAQRYRRLRAEVPAHVTIVAVSKFQPAEAIAEAFEAGVRDFGENYVQEASRKFSHAEPAHRADADSCHAEPQSCHPEPPSCHPELVLPSGQYAPRLRRCAIEGRLSLSKPHLHFIGHLQTNKAKAVAKLFDVVQSVDRADAAVALSKAAVALDKTLPVLLQVNVSPTERYGCPPGEAERLAERIRELEGLRLDGVMAIGPVTGERAEISSAFRLAASILRSIGGSTLSIGMSGDWREAIEAGSTTIRIGTGIFGPRPARRASNSSGEGP